MIADEVEKRVGADEALAQAARARTARDLLLGEVQSSRRVTRGFRVGALVAGRDDEADLIDAGRGLRR